MAYAKKQMGGGGNNRLMGRKYLIDREKKETRRDFTKAFLIFALQTEICTAIERNMCDYRETYFCL